MRGAGSAMMRESDGLVMFLAKREREGWRRERGSVFVVMWCDNGERAVKWCEGGVL